MSESTELFDVIVVGSGFAASFFLHGYCQHAPPDTRILVLERGKRESYGWQLKHRLPSSIDSSTTFVNPNSRKGWVFSLAFGGSSNCWWACIPRHLPNDFRLMSRYGVGRDWPVSYDDLEPHYCEVEQVMSAAGDSNDTPFPRSQPYPHPPHTFSDPDTILKAAYPDSFFHQPAARASRPTPYRAQCCASGVCTVCPINAKFTVGNEMRELYDDPRIMLEVDATVQSVETTGGVATGVTYVQDGVAKQARGDLVVLAANALFNPFLLLRSGFSHPLLGKRLNEQVGLHLMMDLDGVDNYQGSTIITGHGYMLYDGAHRSDHAACVIETKNVPDPGHIRLERGKWRQRLSMKFVFEDLPEERNAVIISPENPALPEVVYHGHSDYTQRAIDRLPALLPDLLKPLPLEALPEVPTRLTWSESHILGTTVMGNDPADSVIDRHLLHHTVRNLLVLGGGAFPTSPPANPTLTIAALSLWAAAHITGQSQ